MRYISKMGDLKLNYTCRACRLCLSLADIFYDIQTACDDNILLSKKIVTLFGIELNTAKNYNTVCQDCYETVCKFYTYHQQVLRNNEKLANLSVIALTIEIDMDEVKTGENEIRDGNDENTDNVLESIVYNIEIDETEEQQEYRIETSEVEEGCIQQIDTEETRILEATTDTLDNTENIEIENEANNEAAIVLSSPPSSNEHSSYPRSKRNSLKIELPDHLKKRISKANGDAKIREFIELNCTICGVKQPPFETFRDMQMHYEKKHNTRGFITCCGKKIYRKDRVMDHITLHVNPNAYKCPICEHSSKSRVLLRIHMKQHLPSDEWPFGCEKCGQRFVLKSQLTNHEATHLNDDEKKYVCDECGKVFALKFVLIKHKQIHSKEKKFFCEICAKSFSNQANLTSHIKYHESNLKTSSRVQCKDCGQWYKNIQTLRTHEHRHRDKREHVCETCGKKCASKNSLSAHVRYVHMKISQFECSVCSKQFRRKPELIEHMARHTGQKLYACPFCSKTFHSSSNYFTHRKAKHPVEYADMISKTTYIPE